MKLQDRRFNIKHIEDLVKDMVETAVEHQDKEEMKDITNMLIAYNGFLQDGTVTYWLEIKSNEKLDEMHDEMHNIQNMIDVDYIASNPGNKDVYKPLIMKHQADLIKEAQRIQCNPGNTWE